MEEWMKKGFPLKDINPGKDTQYFDVLVGYFRASGFYQLHDSIEGVDKTRILVGLNIDEESYQIINEFRNQTVVDFKSHANTKKHYQENLVKEVKLGIISFNVSKS